MTRLSRLCRLVRMNVDFEETVDGLAQETIENLNHRNVTEALS